MQTVRIFKIQQTVVDLVRIFKIQQTVVDLVGFITLTSGCSYLFDFESRKCFSLIKQSNPEQIGNISKDLLKIMGYF